MNANHVNWIFGAFFIVGLFVGIIFGDAYGSSRR